MTHGMRPIFRSPPPSPTLCIPPRSSKHRRWVSSFLPLGLLLSRCSRLQHPSYQGRVLHRIVVCLFHHPLLPVIQ